MYEPAHHIFDCIFDLFDILMILKIALNPVALTINN